MLLCCCLSDGSDPILVLFCSWLDDIPAWTVSAHSDFTDCLSADARVHSGFLDTWEKTSDAITSQVVAAMKTWPDAEVLVTSHSLGAAVAVLDHAHLQCLGIPVGLLGL